MYKPVIAVHGVGFVGGAVSQYFKTAGYDVVDHDPPKGLDRSAHLSRADAHFVCVPTPFGPDGFDDSYVRAAVAAVPPCKMVVVKSTVLPGTTERLQAAHPDKVLMFNPEFLRERCAYDDFVRPDRQIVGVGFGGEKAAADILSILPIAPRMVITSTRAAEMVKYFGNCYLSARVTFGNQMHDLCRAAGVDYDEVRALVEADERIGPGYLDVATDGYRGYGGTCFPKDMRALAQLGRALGSPVSLIEACEEYNNGLLAQSEVGRQWLPPKR